MMPVSGMCFVPAVGLQYALNERWNAYTKYTYASISIPTLRRRSAAPAGETTKTEGGNQ
jgi:hypothetical protein